MSERLAGLVMPDDAPVEAPPEQAEKEAARRPEAGGRDGGDWAMVGAGVALAVLCAVFPWYIFFNQEAFGVRPLTFTGQGALAVPPVPVEERMALEREELPLLDFRVTGTVSGRLPYDEDELPDQPFPGDRLAFRLVEASEGRALIEDPEGFWFVEEGSRLPDGSRVKAIVERGDTWLLITSNDAEVRLAR